MVFARLGRTNTGDATAEDVSKSEKAYEQLGIKLRDVNGEFRAIPEVLDELSQKWSTMTTFQKNYMGEVTKC